MGFNDLYDGFDSVGLENNIGYYREADKIYFVNMTPAKKPKKVSVTMVLPVDQLGEDSTINIPADMVDVIVETVIVKFSKSEQLPDDEINDSVDE